MLRRKTLRIIGFRNPGAKMQTRLPTIGKKGGGLHYLYPILMTQYWTMIS